MPSNKDSIDIISSSSSSPSSNSRNNDNNNNNFSVPPTTKQSSSSSSSVIRVFFIVLIVILLAILVLGSTPPQNNTLLLHSCFPDKQYEPPRFPWKRGQKFPPGKTPLTMLKNREIPPRVLPDSWDGGYGWVFVKYIPSAFETRWAKEAAPIERNRDVAAPRSASPGHPPGAPLCNLLFEKFREENSKYIAASKLFTVDNASENDEKCNFNNFPAAEPVKFDHNIFSRFEYEWKCTLPPCRSPNADNSPRIGAKKYAYIEPLTGLLRHPETCQNYTEFLGNKNYMISDAWSLMHPSRSTMSPPDPKVIFFDLGASTWDEGLGGASQTWFHAVYEGKCLNFTDWYMFEAKRHDPRTVFQLLPGHIKPGYRWYNIFLSTNLSSWDNPLNHLLLEARKEDVVILKIDFDSYAIEAGLVQLIVDHPEIVELIDELYFEHHVNMEILNNYWQTHDFPEYQSFSIKLFTALRERGIRAHSWV